MKISIIGTGYVGLVSGACLADMGNDVICVDIDVNKIESLRKSIIPIYEPGLEEMVSINYEKKTLQFSTDISDALIKSDICFIAVGTPQDHDGSTDLRYVFSVAKSIGQYMTHPMIIVNKSTVPVGTAEKIQLIIQTELNQRNSSLTFNVVSNPEFLKEGTAINDFMHPDRVIVGSDNTQIIETMRDLYAPFMKTRDRFIEMDIRSSEMTKYTANAMLATRISFINEMANICEHLGADINKVRIGIGSDRRIGYDFIYPGCGYGGSCFPKDIRSLVKTAKDAGYVPKILDAIDTVNNNQKHVIANKVIKRFGEDLSSYTFAVWGLAFKPETDDMREASSITIIMELTQRGAKIQAYDPKAIFEAKNIYLKNNENIFYTKNKYDALDNAHALILITEWKEFRSPDFEEIVNRLKNKIIFDGRNQYKAKKLAELGFEYHQIGVNAF